jgi:hypothetical protein
MVNNKMVECTIPVDSAFTDVLFNLAAQGYTYIRARYSGSGDDGCIDEIHAVLRGGVVEDDDLCELTDKAELFTLETDLEDRISDVIYDKILDSASNWYNDEGGGGVLYLSTEDGSYKGDHYINIVHTEHEILSGKLGDN